jgi:RNA polymerase sigma-70 factor, ECF subfamily
LFDNESLEDRISKIYHIHYQDVYRFLVCFSGSQNDAEDLTQEVFIRVLNHISELSSDSNLKTWIYSVAKHVAIDHYRKKIQFNLFGEFLQTTCFH